MTTECTIRFANPSRETNERALGSILQTTEAATAKGIVGGFFFESERSPAQLLEAFAADGFDLPEFHSIEFRPA